MTFENLPRKEIAGKMTNIKSMVLFRELAFKQEKKKNPLLLLKFRMPTFQLPAGTVLSFSELKLELAPPPSPSSPPLEPLSQDVA